MRSRSVGSPRLKLQRAALPDSEPVSSTQERTGRAQLAYAAPGTTGVVSLPCVAPAPRAGLIPTVAAGVVLPVILLALVLIGPFVKDGEAAVVRGLPAWSLQVLRTVPLTWELFSAFEFALTVIAAVAVRPRLCLQFASDDQLSRLRYGSRPEQCLDLFKTNTTQQPQPLVVFVHGGSWSHSRHWMYRLVGRRLADLGFAAAVIGYGQYPGSTVPEMVYDIHSAVDWLRTHGSQHGIDTSRILLLGHSSGGHLCALAALAGGGLGLAGVAVLSSPMDIADHYAWEQGRGVADISALYPAHGGETNFAALSPTRLVAQLASGGAGLLPPFFVGHGTADWTVPPEASDRFAAALAAAGGSVEFRRWPELGHFSVLGALMGMDSGARAAAALEDVKAFLHGSLLGGAGTVLERRAPPCEVAQRA